MLNELKAVIDRQRSTLLQDAAGLLSLIAMLVVGMNLTELI